MRKMLSSENNSEKFAAMQTERRSVTGYGLAEASGVITSKAGCKPALRFTDRTVTASFHGSVKISARNWPRN